MLRTNFTCLEFIVQFYFVFLCVCRPDWRAWPVNWLRHNQFVYHDLHNNRNLNPFCFASTFFLLLLFFIFFKFYNHIYFEIGNWLEFLSHTWWEKVYRVTSFFLFIYYFISWVLFLFNLKQMKLSTSGKWLKIFPRHTKY